MPTVYGVPASPFVRKVLVALTEKGIANDREDVIPVNVSAEYRKISPLGKIPAFRDGDLTLADSSVIIAYLEKTKPEPPEDFRALCSRGLKSASVSKVRLALLAA